MPRSSETLRRTKELTWRLNSLALRLQRELNVSFCNVSTGLQTGQSKVPVLPLQVWCYWGKLSWKFFENPFPFSRGHGYTRRGQIWWKSTIENLRKYLLVHRIKKLTSPGLSEPPAVADPRGGVHPAPPPPYFRKWKECHLPIVKVDRKGLRCWVVFSWISDYWNDS